MNNNTGKQISEGDARRGILTGMALGMALGAAVGLILGDISSGFILGMVVGGAIGYWRFRDLPIGMRYPPHLVRRMIFSGILYLLALIAVFYLLERDLEPFVQIILVLVPTIPGIWFLVSLGSAIASLDELQRRIQLEAIAIAFGGTAIATLTYGMLGLVGVPQANWMYVPVVMVFFWFLGKMWTLWRYR